MRSAVAGAARGGAGRHERAGRAQRGGARGSGKARGGIGHRTIVCRRQDGAGHGARDAGLNRVIEFADVETAMAAVKSFLKTGDVVLLKASRAVRLERIAETLKAGKS